MRNIIVFLFITAFIITSYGRTKPGKTKHIKTFEDDDGNQVTVKKVTREDGSKRTVRTIKYEDGSVKSVINNFYGDDSRTKVVKTTKADGSTTKTVKITPPPEAERDGAEETTPVSTPVETAPTSGDTAALLNQSRAARLTANTQAINDGLFFRADQATKFNAELASAISARKEAPKGTEKKAKNEALQTLMARELGVMSMDQIKALSKDLETKRPLTAEQKVLKNYVNKVANGQGGAAWDDVVEKNRLYNEALAAAIEIKDGKVKIKNKVAFDAFKNNADFERETDSVKRFIAAQTGAGSSADGTNLAMLNVLLQGGDLKRAIKEDGTIDVRKLPREIKTQLKENPELKRLFNELKTPPAIAGTPPVEGAPAEEAPDDDDADLELTPG